MVMEPMEEEVQQKSWAKRIVAFWAWWITPLGKEFTRSVVSMTIPCSLFYVTDIRQWFGPFAYLLLLYPILIAIFSMPPFAGATVALALKLAFSICLGQAYALLIVITAADNWVLIILWLFVLSFVSQYTYHHDFMWGVCLCLAGTILCFLLVKTQYQEFYQDGKSGWDTRKEVMQFTLLACKEILVPSVSAVFMSCLLALLVWPQFMLVEFERILSTVICPKLINVLTVMETYIISDKDAQVAVDLYVEQKKLIQQVETLSTMLEAANLELNWTMTRLGSYYKGILKPFTKLTYMVGHLARMLHRIRYEENSSEMEMPKNDLVFKIAFKADSVLHAALTEEEKEIALKVNKRIFNLEKESVGKSIAHTKELITEFKENMEYHASAWKQLIFGLGGTDALNELKENLHRRSTNEREARHTYSSMERDPEDTIDAELGRAMEDLEETKIWMKSQLSFSSCLVLSGFKIIRRLALLSVNQSLAYDKAHVNVVFSKNNFAGLLKIFWSPRKNYNEIKLPMDFRKRPQRRLNACITSMQSFLGTVSSTKFKLAFRGSLATLVVLAFGFIPLTAKYFDAISGLVAVGIVLFDAGVAHQGQLVTKLFFRIAGTVIGALVALLAWFAGNATPVRFVVMFLIHFVVIIALAYLCKIQIQYIANKFDFYYLGLYTYVTFVALLGSCVEVRGRKEDCDFLKATAIRFINLLVANFISFIFNLVVFPMTAEHELRKGAGTVCADLSLAYGYLTSELRSHEMANKEEAKHFSEMCWEQSISCLVRTTKLKPLVLTAAREMRVKSWGYNSEAYNQLLADCEQFSRILAFLAAYLEYYADRSMLLFIQKDNIDTYYNLQNTPPAKLFTRLRSQVLASLLLISYSLRTEDVIPPDGLRLKLQEGDLEHIVCDLADIYVEQCGTFMQNEPHHLYRFVLHRVTIILNYMCEDAEKLCRELFGEVSFKGDMLLTSISSFR